MIEFTVIYGNLPHYAVERETLSAVDIDSAAARAIDLCGPSRMVAAVLDPSYADELLAQPEPEPAPEPDERAPLSVDELQTLASLLGRHGRQYTASNGPEWHVFGAARGLIHDAVMAAKYPVRS